MLHLTWQSVIEHKHRPLPTLLSTILQGCRIKPLAPVNVRRVIKWAAILGILAALGFIALWFPRTRSLPEGYTYAYFPRGGHRYLIAPSGIKKVGQEVLEYHVSDGAVTGTVRLGLEHDDVRTFRLDLKTHTVTLGDGAQSTVH